MGRSTDPIDSMTLGNMRANGVRSLSVSSWSRSEYRYGAD
jgi:hypothetical protein